VIEVLYALIAAMIAWLNFVLIDVILGLPEKPGVRGAEVISNSIEEIGGNRNGGYMMGNIVTSPDASAGTLLGACAVYGFGAPAGGIFAAMLVYLGNRICSDPGYAGTTGTLSITVIIHLLSGTFLNPEHFIVGTVIAIFTIQALAPKYSSRVIAKLSEKMGFIGD